MHAIRGTPYSRMPSAFRTVGGPLQFYGSRPIETMGNYCPTIICPPPMQGVIGERVITLVGRHTPVQSCSVKVSKWMVGSLRSLHQLYYLPPPPRFIAYCHGRGMVGSFSILTELDAVVSSGARCRCFLPQGFNRWGPFLHPRWAYNFMGSP